MRTLAPLVGVVALCALTACTAPATTVIPASPETPTMSVGAPAESGAVVPTSSSPTPSASTATRPMATPTTASIARDPKDPEVLAFENLASRSYYLVLVGSGTYGCGDTLVPTAAIPADGTPVKTGIEAVLKAAPTAIWDNALLDSRLRWVKGHVDKEKDIVDVWLAGELRPRGTCDMPRIEAQLGMTAASAAGVHRARIWLNDTPLRKAMSQQGEA